jgi:hypothetical protein
MQKRYLYPYSTRQKGCSVNKKEPINIFLILLTAIVMPIITSSMPTIVNNFFNKKPIPYIIRHTNDLENFDILTYFPLKEGNNWEYICEFEFQEIGDSKILNKKDHFTMEVLKKHDFDQYTLFEMKGDPFSIHRDEIHKKFGLLIITNKIYHVPSDIFEKFFTTVIGEDKYENYSILDELTSSIKLIAEMPLYKNQQLGSLDTLIYLRESYKWNVDTEKISYKEVDGQTTNGNRYKISFLTTHDFTEYGFIPYIGFDSFYYNKSGSGDISGKIRLVNYHIK